MPSKKKSRDESKKASRPRSHSHSHSRKRRGDSSTRRRSSSSRHHSPSRRTEDKKGGRTHGSGSPRPSRADSSAAVDAPLPALSSVQNSRRGTATTGPNQTGISPATSAAEALPALHASFHEGHVPSQRRHTISTVSDHRRRSTSTRSAAATMGGAVSSVTIPRGLQPKEVPRPLRAVERRGNAPTKPRPSTTTSSVAAGAAAEDDLYNRWVNAYTYGTAAPGEYSFYKFSEHASAASAAEEAREKAVDDLLPRAAAPDKKKSKRRDSPANVPVPGATSSLPDHAESSDVESMDSWMDGAGYYLVAGDVVGSNVMSNGGSVASGKGSPTAGKKAKSVTNSDKSAGDAKKKKKSDTASKVAAVPADEFVPLPRVPSRRPSGALVRSEAVRATPAPTLTGLQEEQPSSPGRSIPPSVAPFLLAASLVPQRAPAEAAAGPPSLDRSSEELHRVWTPSSEPAEVDEGLLTPEQDPYFMPSHPSNVYTDNKTTTTSTSTTAAGAAVAAAAVTAPVPHPPPPPPRTQTRSVSPYPMQQHPSQSDVAPLSTLKSLPQMEDGLAADPDVSDNDSRHFVSVSRLPNAADGDGASSSGESLLLLPGDAATREMAHGQEEGGERSPVKSRAAPPPPPLPQQQPSQRHPQPRRATQESSLMAMSQSELLTPEGSMGSLPSSSLTSASASASSTSSSSQPLQQRHRPLVPAVGAHNAWTSSSSRLRRSGPSAAVLGAARVLTLLVVKNPTTMPRVTKDGTQVTLPAVPAAGLAAKAVTVDEAVPVREGEAGLPRSVLLREVAAEVRDGHCATLLLSVSSGCGAEAIATVENTLELLLAAMAKRQAEAQAECEQHGIDAVDGDVPFYFKMEASIALISKGKYAKDLVVNREEELGMLAPARPIANPLLGSWCDNTMFQSVRSASQIKTLLQPVQTWLAKAPEEAEKAKEVVCVYVALRQAVQESDEDENGQDDGEWAAGDHALTLSSLLIYISRGQDGAVGILRNRPAATALQRSLLRRVGDGCFTVAAACVRAGADRAAAYAALCADASTVKNNGFLSGDVRRYMETLRAATAKEAAAVQATAGSGDTRERRRAQQRLDLRSDLLQGMTALTKDPAECTIPFYPDRIAAREEAAAKAEAAKSDGANPAAASLSSGMLVQSILSGANTIHIPDTVEALDMFADGRVHTVAIRSAKKACGYELISGTTSGLVRLADGATFEVDELRPRRILPPLHTLPIATHTSALCTLFTNGYNAALASFDGRSSNVFSSPVWYVLAEAIDRALNRSDVQRREVRIAFSVVRGSGEAMDLMNPDSAMVPLQVASSPLFGTAVYTSELHPVTSQDMLRELLYAVAPKAASTWTPNAFLHVLLVNLFSTGGDVFVSSLNLSVFGSHATMCQRVLSNGRGAVEAEGAPAVHPEVLRLHYGLLAGAAASVFLVSLNNREDSDSAMTIADTDVARLSKAANRSGSVQEFIRRTRNGLEKRRQKSSSSSAEERAYLARMDRRITDMLDDNAALLAPNSTAFPKAYLAEQVAVAAPPQPPPQQAVGQPAQQAQRVGRPAGAAASSPTTTGVSPVTVDRSRGVSPQSSSNPAATPGYGSSHIISTANSGNKALRSQRDDSVENGTSVSPHGPSSGKASAAEEASEAATSIANVSHPQWVLGVELGGSAAMEVQAAGAELEWVPTKERFDTDGILFYNSAQSDMRYLFTESCEPMQRMRDEACAGCSCAILGLVDGSGGAGPDLHVRTQPLWRSFTALVLNAAFLNDSSGGGGGGSNCSSGGGNGTGDNTWLEGSELHIRMCAVQDRTLLHDFLLDTEDAAAGATTALPAKVALAANPLFGPVVRNTTVMRAGNLQECQCVFRSGLDALNDLAGEYPSGTVLIASAVLKNVTADDIYFSSITAIGVRVGKDLPALRDILAMDPKGGAPPSLYQYALRGPCHLLCLTTLDSAASVHCVEALRLSQGIRYGATAPVPAGSLRKCLQEQQDVLMHSPNMSPQARANTEHVVRQLVKMMNDPSAPIVIFPFDDDALTTGTSRNGTFNLHREGPLVSPGTLGGGSSGGGGGACCRVTAVITAAGRGETPPLDARTETNTVHVGNTSYPFTEVVLRANNSAVLRPGLISSIVQRVQQGRNTALVVADGAGSNAGASLLSKLVSVFIRNTGDNGHGVNTTLFMSITAVRFPDAATPAAATTGASATSTDSSPRKAMMKDLFSAETQFYPLQVARSPFFGPCVDGARFSSLNRIGDVYLTLKDAQKACCYLKATLVVAIVLKQVTRGANGAVQDMLMSSLFSVLSTADTCNGAPACKVFDDMLKQREAAMAATTPDDPRAVAWRGCLLAQAFGGESFTYGVVGLTANASEAEVAAMMKFGSRLMQVPCRVPIQSSAVKILECATQKLQERGSGGRLLPSQSETPTTVPPAPWDWREIKAEAEEMLNSPDTCKPRAFLCD